MDIEFDPVKDAANVAKHGVSFTAFKGFDDSPHVTLDDRFNYGGERFIARGRIGGVGHCLVFTPTATGARIISFRRARDKEMRRYE